MKSACETHHTHDKTRQNSMQNDMFFQNNWIDIFNKWKVILVLDRKGQNEANFDQLFKNHGDLKTGSNLHKR